MCLGKIGRITRRWDEGGIPMGEADTPGAPVNACLLYHPEVAVGDDVLVHMGFVVDVLDPERAEDARRLRSGQA